MSASSRSATRTRTRAFGGGVALLVAMTVAEPARGQYAYDPSAADELEKPGNLYFGAARDESGERVPDTTIILETSQMNYTLVTDEQGSFRAKLPLEVLPDGVRVSCSRPGYVVIRVTKRLGLKKGKSPVQVDCLLSKAG